MTKKKNPLTSERWYELVDRFDPNQIRELPTVDDRAFILGAYKEMVVIEFGQGWTPRRVGELARWMQAQGVPAIFVPEGTRWLKLRQLSRQESANLDADIARAEERAREGQEPKEAAEHQEATDADGTAGD